MIETTRNIKDLGDFVFRTFSNLEEAVAFYGEANLLASINTTMNANQMRIAKAAAQKPGATADTIQAAIYRFKPRSKKSVKPADVAALMETLIKARRIEELQHAVEIKNAKGLDECYEYLLSVVE